MRVTRADAQTSLGDEPPERTLDEQRDTWNALLAAEAEAEDDLGNRRHCACWQALPYFLYVMPPGHVAVGCDCWCGTCERARTAYERACRQAEQDGSCFCSGFWSANEHGLGVCKCTCQDCLARQAAFWYEEEKRLVTVRLDYWSEEASRTPREYPYGHIEWCSCESCEPITRHNAGIQGAQMEVHRAQAWLREREKQERAAWLKSPAGIAETARLAEIEIAKQRELAKRTQEKLLEISVERERLAIAGPPCEEPVAIEGDQAGTYRAMLRYASCGDPDDTTSFGRLFLADPGNHRPLHLVRLVSNEDCSLPLHVQFRARRPGVKICDATCGSSFAVVEVKKRQQADAVLEERQINGWLLPSAEEILEEDISPRWLGVKDVIGDEARDAVWAAQDFTGFWILRQVYELPAGWEESGLSPGYSAESQTWFELPRKKALALLQPKPKELAGQLAEIAWGDFTGYVGDLCDLLNETYGTTWNPRSLPRAVAKLQPVLSALGIYAGPSGQVDPRTRRPVWIAVVRSSEIELSTGSHGLAILPPAETHGDERAR
jgi:hypothetical protein